MAARLAQQVIPGTKYYMPLTDVLPGSQFFIEGLCYRLELGFPPTVKLKIRSALNGGNKFRIDRLTVLSK
jgi:hypothetical protein